MISNPTPGQSVQLWYAAAKRPFAPYHGKVGKVVVASRVGSKPRNHLVRLAGAIVVVPAGNLREPK